MDVHATNKALLDALLSVVDLPKNIVSLKLEMGVEMVPTLEIVHQVDIDVTHIGSTAHEFAIGHSPKVQYELQPKS